MNGPFVVKAVSTIHPGQAEAYAPLAREICRLVQEKEPRVLAFHIYFTDDGTSEVVLQIHPDAESLENHLKILGEKVRESFAYTDFKSLEIYGTLNESMTKWLERISEGIPTTVYSEHQAGFTRLQAG